METRDIRPRYMIDSKQESLVMLRKLMFGALAATTALTALPASDDAQYYGGYYGRHYYPSHRSHTSVYIGYAPGYYGGYYGPAYYGPTYYSYPAYYGGYYERPYY